MSNKIVTLDTLKTNNNEIKKWVNGVIAGKVDYLGTVAGQGDLAIIASSDSPVNAGDYCRASASFYLYDGSASDHNGEQVHPGDILIYKASSGVPVPSGYYWDVIHTEDPGNFVTLNTEQTISGKKAFSAILSNTAPEQNTVVIGGDKIILGYQTNEIVTQSGCLTNKQLNFEGKATYSKTGIVYLPDSMDWTASLNFPTDYNNSTQNTETIATREWVKANTICSSTIDQEFFNSLY